MEAFRRFYSRVLVLIVAWLALLLVVCALWGCAPARGPRPHFVRQMTVYVPADMADSDVALVLSSIAVHLDAFEREIAPMPPQVLMIRVDQLEECNGGTGYFGGCNHMNGTIDMWAGGLDEVPYAFHEFAHTLLGPSHVGSIWTDTINPRTAELAAAIVASRGAK